MHYIYSMRNRRRRFLYMVVVGILIGFLLIFLIPSEHRNGQMIFHFIASVSITILVWEGNLRIDTLLNRKIPWLIMPAKRILVQVLASIIFSASTIFFSMLFFNAFICKMPHASQGFLMESSIIIGVLVTFIILSVEIGSQFFGLWKKSLVEVEEYKTKSIHAQLQNLKDQVNPHFLFNNLSVLSSLVYKYQDKAVDFINQLSKVYRYLLDTKNTELATLGDELVFINSYTYLLKIRFDTNIDFKIEIPTNKLNHYLPPMALQMLVENTIKHNEVSAKQPLRVEIFEQDGILVIKNNLQLRTNVEKSSKMGLQNIKDRYSFYSIKSIEVTQDADYFIVKLPLLIRT